MKCPSILVSFLELSFLILKTSTGFFPDFGKLAFICRISASIFVRFSLYSVSIFVPKSSNIVDCPALLVTYRFFLSVWK